MAKARLVAAVCAQRESLLRRLAALTDAEWEQACPAPAAPADVIRLDAPARTVRQVVAHLLVADEFVLAGPALRPWERLRGLRHPGGWDLRRVEPVAQQPIGELVALLARRGERFAKLVATAPAAVHRMPVPGVSGRESLCHLIRRRVLHSWLHEQDIAAGTGPATAPSVASEDLAHTLADAVLHGFATDALPRMDQDSGVVRLVVDVSGAAAPGPPARCIWGVDFGRRQFGPRVVRPADALVRLDAATLACVSHGRADRLGSEPAIEVEGDADLAGRLLEAMGAHAGPCAEVPMATAASSAR